MKTEEIYLYLLHAKTIEEVESAILALPTDKVYSVLRKFVLAFGDVDQNKNSFNHDIY